LSGSLAQFGAVMDISPASVPRSLTGLAGYHATWQLRVQLWPKREVALLIGPPRIRWQVRLQMSG
jgi:hypothetical protein